MDYFRLFHCAFLIYISSLSLVELQINFLIVHGNPKYLVRLKFLFGYIDRTKVLTKYNLSKREWQGDLACLFCDISKTTNHQFVTCFFISAIWSWIANCNGLYFDCTTIEDFWFIDTCIPLKDTLLVKWLIRAAILQVIWLTRNKICFNNSPIPSLQSIGTHIITLTSYWCKTRNDDTYFKLTLILPMNVSFLNQVGSLIFMSDSDTR